MEIREFQNRIKENFFHKDSLRGGEKTFLWLMEEIGELSSAILNKDKKNIEEELADSFAWLFSLANIYEIDVEKALSRKYPPFCQKCHSSPCSCKSKPI